MKEPRTTIDALSSTTVATCQGRLIRAQLGNLDAGADLAVGWLAICWTSTSLPDANHGQSFTSSGLGLGPRRIHLFALLQLGKLSQKFHGYPLAMGNNPEIRPP
jgi:hypothetical protein